MPPGASIPLALLFAGLFWLVFGIPTGLPLFAGFLIGYLIYDYTHYYLHHFVPKSEFGKRLREAHMRHHFQDHRYGFGVSVAVLGRRLPHASAYAEAITNVPPAAQLRLRGGRVRWNTGEFRRVGFPLDEGTKPLRRDRRDARRTGCFRQPPRPTFPATRRSRRSARCRSSRRSSRRSRRRRRARAGPGRSRRRGSRAASRAPTTSAAARRRATPATPRSSAPTRSRT